jgi:pullulanase
MGMRRVIIHYHREDGDYTPWSVWLWPEGCGGQSVAFSDLDYFGRIARCTVGREHKRIGFLIRGESWEKDIAHDRYIEDFVGDTAEVWLVGGDPQVYLAPPAHLREKVRVFSELELTVHYYRHDGSYAGWNLWIWEPDSPGRQVDFTEQDQFGAVARITLREQSDAAELGLIPRKSAPGLPWAAKDGTRDRFIPLYYASDHGRLAVWLMQDDPRIYYREEDVDRTPKLTLASLDDTSSIRVECYLPVYSQGPNWGFRLFQGSEEVPLAQVQPLYAQGGPRAFLLKTAEPLDLTRRYVLRHDTHGQKALALGRAFDSREFYEAFHYDGDDLGATLTETETIFKVWAPTADKLEVVLYDKGVGGRGKKLPMTLGDKGVWSAIVPENLEGKFYTYRVTHGTKTEEVVDPYAKSAGVNGRRGQIVDLNKTNPPGWEKVKLPPLASPVDAVIYEVHVRDISSAPCSGIKARGQYLGLVERGTKTPSGIATGLDHLIDLGVTHVHLLPIFDFATVDEADPQGSYNWGYDPLNFNVPEGSYASDPTDGRVRIRELKKMIQGLSDAGIGVIMDVVYNHTFHCLESSFHKLVPGYYYRHDARGGFSNGSGCGNELADERSMVRKFILDSVVYWAKEYKLAGFRFDLMGLHHLDTMREVRRALDEVNPGILIYGEGWAAGGSTLPEFRRAVKENTNRMTGIASFCNDLRDGIKGHVFHTKEGGFIQGQGLEESVKFGLVGAVQHPQVEYGQVLYSKGPWAWHPSQSVAYAEAHDNLTLWDKLLCTTASEDHAQRLKMIKLAHTIILTAQGIPFLHAGQDFARTKGGDPNSYQSPDHVNQLDWERKGEFLELFMYTKGLIELRRSRPAFRLRTGEEVRRFLQFLEVPRGVIGFALGPHAGGDSFETILVFFNSNQEDQEVAVDAGCWEVLVSDQGVGHLSIVTGPKVVVPALSPLILAREDEAR